ncbi:TIR domain-containing protein, partial [uncultured Thiodictyon sp.]|uniref:TIR domain-containing protein n=1 Tax=uncultured Thiodictyon sp. TaxID=1846217 RepID=UPI0025D9B7D2
MDTHSADAPVGCPAAGSPTFDCFLSHNSRDKPAVRELATTLRAGGISVWLDEEQLRPGVPWQPLLESGIAASRSVAVLVGADGLGPWEDEEQQAALRLAVRDQRPVIPVLLPAAPQTPNLPMFLGNRTWVDLRRDAAAGLDLLIWGITGRKPGVQRAVAASTAPSPPVVARPARPNAAPDRLPADAQPGPAQQPTATAPKRDRGPSDKRCDVLLLYVNDKERTAIIETFADPGGRPPQPRIIQGLPCLDLGEIGGRHIFATATNMGSATPGGSATIALDAIAKLAPRWILAVGVAFGMNPDKHPIGTILVSDRVSCYEPQRVGKKTVRRGDTVTVHPHLKQQFQMVSTLPYWTGDPVCFGEILSGEKLIDEPGFKDKLRRAYPEAIGGEMEAAGIYSAALLESRQWIVVKAVCDYADGNKGENKEARQTLAAGNAARFVRHVLASYCSEPDTPPPEEDPGSDQQRTASPIHDDAVAAIAESLRRLPELCATLSAQPAIGGATEPAEIAKRLCAREAKGLRAAMTAFRLGLPEAALQIRRRQGDVHLLRTEAHLILGWMAVTAVLAGYEREDAALVKPWFDGAAFYIPLGRDACLEVLTARWRDRPAEWGIDHERWESGPSDLAPKGEFAFDNPLLLDLSRAVDYIWRLIYQHIEGRPAPARLHPEEIEQLAHRLNIQLTEKGRRRRLVIDGRGGNNPFNFSSVLRAIPRQIRSSPPWLAVPADGGNFRSCPGSRTPGGRCVPGAGWWRRRCRG